MERCHEGRSRKEWSMSQHHVLLNILLWKCLSCWRQESLLLTGPGIYPQVYHRTTCPAVLNVRASNKKQRTVGLSQISKKEILFHLLWQPRALGSNLKMSLPFLNPPKNSITFTRIITLKWKESLLVCFENCLSVEIIFNKKFLIKAIFFYSFDVFSVRKT